MKVANSNVNLKIQTPRHSKNQCFVLQWKVVELKSDKVWGVRKGLFLSIQRYGIQGN
jgi:hypothetical protein